MNSSGGRMGLRLIEWLAAIAGAVVCVLVPALFAQSGGNDFPFPGLYFIEIALCGLVVVGYVAFRPRLSRVWAAIPWIAAGIMLAFVILGGFSVGPYLIPALSAFIVAGFAGELPSGKVAVERLGILLIAALAQGATMLFATLAF